MFGPIIRKDQNQTFAICVRRGNAFTTTAIVFSLKPKSKFCSFCRITRGPGKMLSQLDHHELSLHMISKPRFRVRESKV